MDNISLSAFVTVNTLVVVAALWVSLPSNVAVTVYVPAVMPVMLVVALPLTEKVYYWLEPKIGRDSIIPKKEDD